MKGNLVKRTSLYYCVSVMWTII